MLRNFILAALVSCLALACASKQTDTDIDSNSNSRVLMKYAHVNCLFWYFQDKGYDAEDLRKISGGIVETSDISIEKFQQVALFMKDYAPGLETKGAIDPKLNRCFHLESNKTLSDLISQ